MPAAADSSSSNHIVAHVLLALGLGACVGFACIANDWIAAGFVVLVIAMAYFGYWSGVLKIASSVFGILAAIRFARPFSPFVAKYTDRLFDAPEHFREPISIGCAGLLVAVGIVVGLRLAGHVIFRSKPHWRGIDRCLGAAAGTIQGILIGAIILFAAVMLEPIAKQHILHNAGAQSNAVLAQLPVQVVSFTYRARQSSIGPLMDIMQPWQDRFNERVHEMTETIVTSNSDDPSFKQALQQLVEEAKRDPDKRRLLSSQSGIDEQTLRSVLDSAEFDEAINAVVDE